VNLKYLPTILIAILYYIFGKLCFYLIPANAIISINIFLPEGIALAFAISFGYKIVPGIFIGQFLLALSTHIAPMPALFISIINSIEAIIAIYLFQKLEISKKLDTFGDILKFSFMILFILQPFSAILSNSVLINYIDTSSAKFLYNTFAWYFGNIMGQLLLAPLLIKLIAEYKQINFKELFFYTAIYSFYIYALTILLDISNPFILLTLSLGVIIFITIKKNILYANTLILFNSFITAYSIKLGIGAFSNLSIVDNTINYNLYILSHIIIIWILGVLFEERKQYQKTLEKRIEEEVEKNKKQQLTIMQKNRLAQMGELLNMIAHQWKQPLNNLVLLNQILIHKYEDKKLTDKDIEFFKINSKEEINYMSNIINNFINFFKKDDEIVYFSINHAIKNTIDLIKPILDKNKIKLRIISNEEYYIYGYPKSISQTILNILNNSIEAFEKNDIQNKLITISISKYSQDIIIEISDNAGGIDEDIIDNIFDPYFTTKIDKHGTGLGLFISKTLIENHFNSKLDVENIQNGVKFIITLKGESNV